MGGYRLQVVAKKLFPYVCYSEPSTNTTTTSTISSPTFIPCDSLDFRILDTAAALLNFTRCVGSVASCDHSGGRGFMGSAESVGLDEQRAWLGSGHFPVGLVGHAAGEPAHCPPHLPPN
ncbi:hypothetical protein E2C01_026752 [Portunus trituberculatus]|uniref:Uncharacterized protein n=1 Tax=Portunus trituberculatus TaxID=210409 RepID=A0A5B7EK24_PORTR|nr:hypothetical protein [Portunus trituberculatus]